MKSLSAENRLRELMQLKNWTQKDLAALLGISQPAVSLYLQGRMPPGDVLFRIARLGGTTVEWLLTGREAAEDRVGETAPAYGDEAILLELWHRLPPPMRQVVLHLVRELNALSAEKPMPADEG